ncbi:MAG: four helix bundle protein [Candidatus Hydrogenedentales bacterium]
MTTFDHEKLHVYQASLDLVGEVWSLTKNLDTKHKNARDQLIRASQSIPLNIAEGNGKRTRADRNRFLGIAAGSAMECAAALDILVCCEGCTTSDVQEPKNLLSRIIAMLTKMTAPLTDAKEEPLRYRSAAEYEFEYEDEYEAKPEQDH